MSFGTQGSYRIGEWLKNHPGGGGRNPDGDHIAHIVSMDLAATKDNKPQFKVVSKLLDIGGRQHTWYYPLWEEMLWKLFNDVLAAGCPPDFDPGPPGPAWLDAFRPGFVNKVFNVKLWTDGDFQNTKIVSIAHPGAQPAQDPTQQPKPAPAGFPAAGNVPTPIQATVSWTGMQPDGPKPTQWGGTVNNGATPEQMVDAASLFKNA